MKKFIFKLFLLSLMSLPVLGASQSLTWTGAAGTDFYNEQNWIVTGTENIPADGLLVQGEKITFELIMNDAQVDLGEDELVFSSADHGLQLSSSTLTLGSISTGRITVADTSTLILNATTPILSNAKIDLQDNHSWIKLLKVDPFVADTVYLQHMSNGSTPLVHNENMLINQYYFQGSLIRLFDQNFHAITLFDGEGLSGSSMGLKPITIHKRNELDDFDNVASSFRLERGYQAVLSVYQNGKGLGQTFIASEEALEIDLPLALNNAVSFVRVMPWNWVTKKGGSGNKGFEGMLGNTWVYNWGLGAESTLNKEFAPMSWGAANAGTAAKLIEKENVTHALGFNESDNCNGQSGQYGGLCQIEIAVPSFSFLQSTGLRLVSPSPRENGPFGWLKDFRDAAQEANVRYDVLGVHWYDWGANPKNTPFEDPEKVFTRFKNYLDRVYNEHGLPIWITEFNANANRDSSVHIGFLKLALPYLESLDYIERYDFFSVNPDVAGNRDDIVFGQTHNPDGSLTLVGKVIRDHVSTPSIPEVTWSEPNFLDRLDKKVPIHIAISADTVAEGEVLTIKVSTEVAVGAPQQLSLVIDVDESQYSLRDTNLIIEEGASEAETILQVTDDDEVEDTVTVSISLTNLSEGIEWSGTAASFIMTSEDVKVIPLGTSQNKLSIYPNPVKNTLRIQNQTPESITSVKCIAMDGRIFKLEQITNGMYDVSHISPGIYTIHLKTRDKGMIVNKIIIQ